jgi:hypothetical protein
MGKLANDLDQEQSTIKAKEIHQVSDSIFKDISILS